MIFSLGDLQKTRKVWFTHIGTAEMQKPSSQRMKPVVDEPRPLDVLCGKSQRCVTHEGTRIFRHLIEANRVRYQQSKTKVDRMDITKEIVSSIEEKARFLKYNRKLERWEKIDTLAARDKVSHALRCAHQRANYQKGLSVQSDTDSLLLQLPIRSCVPTATITEEMEDTIGDQETILSCFNFRGKMRDLPVAASLVTVFRDEAEQTGKSKIRLLAGEERSHSHSRRYHRLEVLPGSWTRPFDPLDDQPPQRPALISYFDSEPFLPSHDNSSLSLNALSTQTERDDRSHGEKLHQQVYIYDIHRP